MLLTLANNVVAVVENLCTRPPWQVAGVIQSWAFFCIALQFTERESDGCIMMKQTILCTNRTKQGSLTASVQTSRRSQANRKITGPVNGNGVKRNNQIIPNSRSSSIHVLSSLFHIKPLKVTKTRPWTFPFWPSLRWCELCLACVADLCLNYVLLLAFPVRSPPVSV